MRIVRSEELSPEELEALRRMVVDAFDGHYDQDDWDHTLGGVHVIALEGDAIVAHAAVVERTLRAGDRPLRTGYVEGVATRADARRQGQGAQVMRAAGRLIRERYELGGLSDGSGVPGFYARLGWESWQGPTFVAAADGPLRTEEDDDAVMVLRTPTTPDLDLTGSLTCDWRAGDVW